VGSKYEDMVYMPHHVSLRHPRMSRRNRAAQFAPFAAVTGHESSVREASRITEEKINLDDSYKEELNTKLMIVLKQTKEKRTAIITYFMKDNNKPGGSYLSVQGIVEKFDEFKKIIILENGINIPIDDVYDIKI
jgi:hypothetical protein